MLEEFADTFSALDIVDAVVLAGSKTGLINDDMSDYDVYIYSQEDIPRDVRASIIKEFSTEYTVGNSFFEEGDEFFFAAPKRTAVDIMYRRTAWAKDEIDWVWNKCNPRLGYTTCFLYNLKTSKPLFDRNGIFAKTVEPLAAPYPDELVRNIIKWNHPMLRGNLEAPFYTQIELAVKRDDIVSMNHRTAALLSSYFDILFAANKQLHPGEKKLLAYAKRLCPQLPENFEEDIRTVIQSVGNGEVLLPSLTKLLDSLDEMLHALQENE